MPGDSEIAREQDDSEIVREQDNFEIDRMDIVSTTYIHSDSGVYTADHQLSNEWSVIDRALLPHGLKSLDVGAAGNCQFLALAHHLGDIDHTVVRQRVVAELLDFPARYFEFTSYGRDVIGYFDFVNDISIDGAWGDHVTLVAAANAFGRRIVVVHDATNLVRVDIEPHLEIIRDGNESDIWLAYMNGNHYRATALIENVWADTIRSINFDEFLKQFSRAPSKSDDDDDDDDDDDNNNDDDDDAEDWLEGFFPMLLIKSIVMLVLALAAGLEVVLPLPSPVATASSP